MMTAIRELSKYIYTYTTGWKLDSFFVLEINRDVE